MMSEIKLVHNDGRVPSIIFPKGKMKEGGTCQFATKKCLYWCVCTTKPNQIETAVYNYFKEHTAVEIFTKIHMELLDRNKLFLQWFAWGDCPQKMTLKIAWIIENLREVGVTQIGFTRNEKLWEEIERHVKFALTLETKEKVKSRIEKGLGPGKLVAFPDYDAGKTYLYDGMKSIQHETSASSCSGHWYEETDEFNVVKTYEASCDLCSENKRGCFKQKASNG